MLLKQAVACLVLALPLALAMPSKSQHLSRSIVRSVDVSAAGDVAGIVREGGSVVRRVDVSADAYIIPKVAASTHDFSKLQSISQDGCGSYQYMPGRNLLMCTCAKCGSTSLYNFIYKNEFSKPWVFTDPPWIQETSGWRWQGKWKIVEKDEAEKLIKDPKIFSYALIRDPKDRLISGWKSKVSCDNTFFGTDTWDRDRMVPDMLKLQGRGKTAKCLNFKEFLEVLTDLKAQGKDSKVNEHFLLQQHGCFRDFDPKLWSQSIPVGDGHVATELAKHMHYSESESFEHRHQSSEGQKADPYAGVDLDADTLKMLDAYTSEDYSMLGVSLAKNA